MKISIVTVVLNSRDTIAACIESVACQRYPDIEHIVIDGGSTDGTLDIIKKNVSSIALWQSELDDGLYHAMNKGIRAASGTVVGILNADDIYPNQHVIKNIVEQFKKYEADTCYGDLAYVKRDDPGKVVRYWRAGRFDRKRFWWGWMPPHPAFFVKKDIYNKYGILDTRFKIAADYELMLRFLYRYRLSASYLNEIVVKMNTGGVSRPGLGTMTSIRENYRAWVVNSLRPNPLAFAIKPLSKLLQYGTRP